MDDKGIMHNLHLYLDTENAPAKAVAKIVGDVSTAVGAELIVMAASNKVRCQWRIIIGADARCVLCE